MRGLTAATVLPAAVEVEVDLEPRRQVEVRRRGGLLQRVVRCVGVHLEHHVSLVPRTLHLLCEHICRAGSRPCCDGHHVAHLLPQQLVNGDLQVLAHDVVESGAETQVEVVHHEVKGAAVNQALERRGGRGRSGPVIVAIPDDAHVRLHLEDYATVDAAHPTPSGSVVIALRQRRVYGDAFDIGDLHASPREQWLLRD